MTSCGPPGEQLVFAPSVRGSHGGTTVAALHEQQPSFLNPSSRAMALGGGGARTLTRIRSCSLADQAKLIGSRRHLSKPQIASGRIRTPPRPWVAAALALGIRRHLTAHARQILHHHCPTGRLGSPPRCVSVAEPRPWACYRFQNPNPTRREAGRSLDERTSPCWAGL